MKQIGILPWQTYNRDGYGKLDVRVIVSETFGNLIVKRQMPSEEHPGRFVSYHNENRVTQVSHADRADAVAEAERYFYSLPEFSKSNNAKLLNAALTVGMSAYEAGKSIYENPHPRTTVEASQWATGWLRGFGNNLAGQFSQGIEPTMRANAQLESDLQIATSRLQAFAMIGEFMDILSGVKIQKDGVGEFSGKPLAALQFFADFRSGDLERMSSKWPAWSQFLHDKRLGPPPENEIDPVRVGSEGQEILEGEPGYENAQRRTIIDTDVQEKLRGIPDSPAKARKSKKV